MVETAKWIAAYFPAAPQVRETTPDVTATNDAPVPASSGSSSGGDVHVSLAVEHRRASGNEFSSVTQARIGLEGLESRHVGFGVFLLAGDVELKDGSAADRAAHGAFVLGWGLGARFYFTPENTFLRPYVTAEASWVWVHWSYRDEVVTGGETVSSDSKQGIDGYAGAGLVVGSNKRFNLFGELGAGGVGFIGTTRNEVNSDLFGSFGYVGAKAGMRIRF